MKKNDYDVIVIGGGAAGLSAAKTAIGLGKKTAIVERNRLGGECTWTGCVPSKALIHWAGNVHVAYQLNNNKPSAEIRTKAMEYIRSVIRKVYEEEKPESLEKSGISIISGNAHFVDKHTISVDGRNLKAGRFIIAAGSSPFIPPIEGLNAITHFTNENIFNISRVPESLLILGGGPIGIEIAQAFNRLGSNVTVVEMMDRILFREEKELTDILENRLRSEGVTLLTHTKALKAERRAGGVALTVENPDQQISIIAAESVLVAVGRQPNTEGLKLENAGVKYSRSGISVNGYLQTSQPDIYACGDIVGPYYFSHMAGYQGITAGLNVSLPFRGKANDRGILWTTYTDPELAHLGMTEAEARERYGKSVRVYNVPYSRLDRAKTEGREEGLAKFILNKGKLVGAHIAGHLAGELIHEAQVIRAFGIPFKRLQSVMHAYPSYSDIIRIAARDAYIEGIRDLPIVRLISKFAVKREGK